jgi:hypothetical protein
MSAIINNNNSNNNNSQDHQRSRAEANALRMICSRIVPQTKSQYESKIKSMIRWFQLHNPQCVDANAELILPLSTQSILTYFGYLIDGSENDYSNNMNTNKTPAFSTVRGHKSALVWYYNEKSVTFDTTTNQTLEKFLQGYKREVSSKKLNGDMEVFEGKHHITFNGYCLLARKFMTIAPDKLNHTTFNTWNMMLFAWPFFVLQWNLMARSATVASIMLQHISWQDDAMIITTPKHKGDQEGEKSIPRHVYANPLDPYICPILALAVLTFSKSFYHDPNERNNYRLFEGEKQEARFSKLLGRILDKMDENEANKLGAKKEQIGTHSARKGSPTYCLGMVGGPSAVQVFLRAGWSLGNVQDRYLFNGDGGDQLTGRVACGLPNTDCSFATLPPHFDSSFDQSIIDWTMILPSYNKYPNTFKQVVPYLLASIVYHEQWLRENLSTNHPLFSTHLFASSNGFSILNQYRNNITLGVGRSSRSTMIATGIPPHLALANELLGVAKNVLECKTEIQSQCEMLPQILTNTMVNKFSINGATPVTMDDMDRIMNTMIEKITAKLSPSRHLSTDIGAAADPESLNGCTQFQFWMWGTDGKEMKLHMVPKGWKLPTMNIKDIWNMWWYGHYQDKIQPYRFLKWYDLINNAQVTQLSKTKRVMNAIEEIARDRQYIEAGKSILDLQGEANNQLFDAAFTDLLELLKPGSTKEEHNRFGDSSVGTVCNLIGRLRKRKRDTAATDVIYG